MIALAGRMKRWVVNMYEIALQVNLLHGLPQELLAGCRETCTACAGTMILEFGALSRLTGEPIFEVRQKKSFHCPMTRKCQC